MSKMLRNTFIFIGFLSLSFQNVHCDSNNQPRITSQEGHLIFESARDKNVTIRLPGSSSFMVNDVNVLKSLQKFSRRRSSISETDLTSLPNDVQTLKTDVRRMTNRLRRVENNTPSLPNGRIRRLQSRVLSLMRRVSDIESKLGEDDCSPNPCKNGGTCYDLYENYHCECPSTWTGKTCEQDVNECYSLAGTDLGCQNNAVCVNEPGSYQCVCSNGFTGVHCRERGTDCINSRPGELCGNGACIPANNKLGYQCICNAGWKINNVTNSCTVDVNECLEALVACHTSCINIPGSFMCGPCPAGYTGNGITCRDIDECAVNNGGCSTMPKVQCINTEGSHRCGNCPPGWVGDGRYCTQADTNTCAVNNICHPLARCEYISNMMICVCPEGMTGSGYGPAGCRSGSANPCNEHQCQNGGTCISHGSTYSCVCPLGYDPPYCSSLNPCESTPCLNGGTCVRQGNTVYFRCVCPRDSTGRFCQIRRNTCGSVIRDRTGDLTHPSDGGEYKSNEACAWVIRTDENLILNVSFSHFAVQSDPECSKDWLQINDGRSLAKPLIGRFCGDQLPRGGNILSSQNALFLWFRTDNVTNSGGFSLSWTSTTPICGGRQDVDAQGHGVIKSPGHPGKSPPNRDCEWIISAPIGKRILLRFYEVVMDRSVNCSADSLIIYDTNEILERICETGVPAPKYTSTNVAKLHFHTDTFGEDSLFQAHFEVVEGKPGCGGLFTEPEGKILFTLDMAHCAFLIQQPNGTRISIGFSKGDLSFGLSAIRLFDGKTEEDPIIFESYDESLPQNTTSTGNFMLIVITVRDSFMMRSKIVIYEANYKLVCGQELRDSLGGFFMTPNYPRPYYAGLSCEYTIVGPLNSVLHLNITDYDVSEYTEACDDDSDFIEIFYKIGGPAERHCKDVPLHIVAPSNHLRIDFYSNTNPQRRRGIFANYYFEQIGCGGVLRDYEGSFKLLDPTSATSSYCEWILEAPKTHIISLDLLYTRFGTKCPAGEPDLRIYLNGSEPEGRLVESYCGPEKHIVTILPSHMATVFLKLTTPYLSAAVAYGIEANYTFIPRTTSCGGNYSLLSGSIQSPGWPGDYFDSMDCVWVIHAPLGHKIELVPKNFSLEKSSRCGDDYLEIRNGMSDKSPLIGKYCGYDIPPHIPSFTNHLYLHFHSDSSFPFAGFDILFQQTSTGCGGSLSSHIGSIASPHYPDISRGPVQCDWKITVSQGSSIDVRITKLSPEADLCSNGFLIIYDGDDSLAKRLTTNCSSTDAVIRLKSSQNVIFIRYSLPEIGAAENQQFYLDYKTNCQQTLDAMQGVIESPNFPDDYPNYLRCEWSILGRKAETISLTFSHFEMEPHDMDCSYDTFQLIDMKDDETLKTQKICRIPSEMFTSDGNRVVIKFSTDFSNAARGFRLEFKRNGCGGYQTRTSGIIGSPNYPYSVDCDCEWLIETVPGKQIILDIFDTHIENDQGDCSTNGLVAKNDKSDTKDLLKYCHIQNLPLMTVTSHGSSMFVRFYSDSKRSRKYFKATYRAIDAECGGTFRGVEGEITSPNYPQNYSENSYCEWMISVESSYTIEFFFDVLDLPPSNNCSQSFVEVYEGIKGDKDGKLMDRYCTKGLRIPIRTTKNRINIIFSSGDGPPAKGFVLKYKKTCGGILTENTGFLKSYVQDRICIWQIRSPDEGSKITINFMRIECHCDGLNETECLKIRGVKVAVSENSPPMLSFCEVHPPDFTSDGQSLAIAAANVSFVARYSTVDNACGGQLTSLRGFLTSPYYPESYPLNIECVWTIQASLGNYLVLNILDMDIPVLDNCNQAYLEVRERTSSGKLAGVFCSETPPSNQAYLISQQIWIKFRSPEDGVGKGFKLSWTYAQINDIVGFNGRIQPPPIVSLRSEKEPFQWRITVPRDNVIILKFKEYNTGLQLFDGFDGNALPIEIQLSPWEVTSSTNVVFLISDNQILEDFMIEYKALSKDAIVKNETVSGCNETLAIGYGPMVMVTSPGYPTGYADNMRCEWILKADHPTRHVVLQFLEIDLEAFDSCSADEVKVSSSSNLIDWHEELKMCKKPKTRMRPVHGTPYLKLDFRTDHSVNKTGFSSFAYTVCGGNLTGAIGQILDVDVHNTTNEELVQNCTWNIEVRAGRRIQFTFQFPTSNGKNTEEQCDSYALIRDGIDDGARFLPPGRICSYKDFNGTVMTTTNRASVKYYIQSHNPFLPYEVNMWNLTYREYSDCGGEVRLTHYARTVNITSPNYPNVPNAHTECIWRIVGPPGEAIKGEFVDRFDMNSRLCAQEFVELRDGSTELAELLGKYCVRPGTIRTSGNILYLRYLTDIPEPRNGFKLNVSLSTCGGTFTQFSNVITSPNYPAPGGYPSNSICDYVIKASIYSQLNLTFGDVNLPFNATNLNGSDHIRIYQVLDSVGMRLGDEVAVIYGNTTTMPVVQVDSNEVLIRLFTFKANSVYRGFKVKYDRIYGACFRDVSAESGILTLNTVPRRMSMFVLCRWKITVPKGRRVKLDIMNVDAVLATGDFRIAIYNDFSILSRIISLNGSNISNLTTILSSDNKMFVRIFGPYTPSIHRLQATYSSSELSNCPDDITTETGSLSLAGFEPSVNFFCNSDFVLNGLETISFNISRLIVDMVGLPVSTFAVRFKSEPLMESLRLLNRNVTNSIIAMGIKRGSVSMIQNESVKVKAFEATFTKHACGGDYRIQHKFDISLPNMRLDYGPLDCAWHLSSIVDNRNGYDLAANFSFTLPCENEFVSIHKGPSEGHLQVGRLCRGVTFNTTRLASHYMYVVYHTTAYSPSSQLRMSFTRASNCGERLMVENGQLLQFTSNDYKNNLSCVWDLQTVSGFYLRLDFTGRFFIEDSINCTKDYLEIRKMEGGIWTSLSRYCGRNLPSAINTTSNRLQVIFRSDSSNTGDGFTIEFQRTCNAVFNVTSQTQFITYPSRWSMSRVRLNCEYTLQTESEKNIYVKFNKFALGQRNRCALAQMSIQKRSRNKELVDVGTYCQDNAVKEVRGQKLISLKYQAYMETGGYEIEFVLDSCGGQINQTTWIQSLSNDEGTGYAHNMNCVWNISAPEGHNIVIQFKYLILESNDGCSMDYLAIYRGSQIKDDKMEAKICGNRTSNVPTYHIEDNSAVVVAVSDASVSMEGFSAKIMFSKPCDERLTLTMANSPVVIERNFEVGSNEFMSCNYRIMAPPDFRIETELIEIQLVPPNATCKEECGDCSYLEVLDSLRTGGLPLGGKYCWQKDPNPKLLSSFKDAIIRINAELQGSYRFKAKLRLVSADCSGWNEYVLEDDNPVRITSKTDPNGLYPSNVHCSWKITSNRDFELRFEKFNLQNSSDVTGQCLDYVHIAYSMRYTLTRSNDEHCGTLPSYTIYVDKSVDNASAEITFHTDEAVESTGFILIATNRASCNRTYNNSHAMVSGVIDHDVVCSNFIDLPENYTVNILFPGLYLMGARLNCSDNFVRIYDRKTNRQIFEDCSEQYVVRKIYTTTNQVRIDIKLAHDSNSGFMYFGSQKSLPPGCGGSFEISKGYLASPKYQEYTNSSVCRWNFTTAAPNRIEFDFTEFNMGSVCKSDYLDIIDIADNGEETRSRRFCEQNFPRSYLSKGNRVAIVSVAAADFDGTGWALYFRSYTEGLRRKLL